MSLTHTETRLDNETLRNRVSGANLVNLLKKHKVSKYRLSKDLGVSYQAVMDWTKGRFRPTVSHAMRIGRYFGIIDPDKEAIETLRKKIRDLTAEIDRIENKKREDDATKN